MQLWALKIEGFYGCLYTPLYEKGIKETQNEPMETTVLFFYSFGIDSHHHPMLYSPWQSLLFYLFRWKQRGKEDHSASWRRAPSPIKMTTVSLKNTDTIFKTGDHCVSNKNIHQKLSQLCHLIPPIKSICVMFLYEKENIII